MIPFYKRTDAWLTAAILLICLAVLLVSANASPDSAPQAEIAKDGAVCRVVSLEQDATFAIDGTVFEVQNHRIRFKSATCPDQLCVHMGFIGKPNELAVCLPARLSVRIVTTDSASQDAIAS